MIDSTYIVGKTKAPFDKKVTQAIRDYAIEGGGNTLVIAISNMDGEVYRVLNTTGMGTFFHITSALTDIGLKDKLKDSMMGENGFDSLFVIPKRMKVSLRKFESIDTPSMLEDLSKQDEILQTLPETERESLIQSRIGQGEFRQSLIVYWGGCAVTDSDFIPLLRASHIKPWRDSNNDERLDSYNGFLLSPNLDSAFDSGYISFDSKGKIILSEALDPIAAYALRITPKLKIKPKLISESHIPYLEYHQSNVLKQD